MPISTVNISGSLYHPATGAKITTGRLILTPENFIATGTYLVGRESVSVDVPVSGDLDFGLVPSSDVQYLVQFDPSPDDTATPLRQKSGYWQALWTIPSGGYRYTVLEDNPIAYWRLGESSGTTALDETGNGNGTYVGSVTRSLDGAVAGSNKAVSFNAGGAGVSFANKSAAVLSLEFWHKRHDASYGATNWRHIFSQAGVNEHHAMVHVTSRAMGVWSSGWYSSGFVVPNDNAWHHYVMIIESAVRAHLYVDGAFYSTFSMPLNLLTKPVSALGAVSGYGYYPGPVDEAAVYDYALTAGQIAAHYAAAPVYIDIASL